MGTDVAVQRASYGLELVDALTGGPLVGRNAVVETSSQAAPYLVNASRWVFQTLPTTPATFVITADFYVGQTVTTGSTTLPDGTVPPDPTSSGPGYLATITMMPRTGYPFPPTLTRVVGLVQFASAPVAGATVTLTPTHDQPATSSQPASSVPDPAVTVTTTDDGQYTYWLLPQFTKTTDSTGKVIYVMESPPIANQLTVGVTAILGGISRSRTLALNLDPNTIVTNAPTITLT